MIPNYKWTHFHPFCSQFNIVWDGSGEGAWVYQYLFLDPNTFDRHCTNEVLAVHHGKLISFLNIFLPLEILLKTVFCSYSWAVFWSLSCHRELKLTTKPFTGCTLCARCKILACEVWACTESKILCLKVTQQSCLLLFTFSPPLFFHFSCLIFSSFAGHLVGYIFVGKVFRDAFRILIRIIRRKER